MDKKLGIASITALLLFVFSGLTHATCPSGATGNLLYNDGSGNCAGLSGSHPGVPLSNGSSAPTLFPMNYFVDGTTYAYSATGINNALTAGAESGGVGTNVMLPATESLTGNDLPIGTGNITMASDQCVIGQGHAATFLTYSGNGAAFKFPAGTHDACLQGVTIYIGGTPKSGQECVEIDGDNHNADGNPSHDILIRDVYCYYLSKVAGTEGFKFVGTGAAGEPSDVSLIHMEDDVVYNADKPYDIDDSEQDFFRDNTVGMNYTAPAVNFGSNAALILWEGGNLTGSGTTGDAFKLSGDKITVNTSVNSGAADCFDDIGGNNFLKCEEGTGSITIGTIAGTSTAYLDNLCKDGC